MPTDLPTSEITLAGARLWIHVDGKDDLCGDHSVAVWRWLRAHCFNVLRHEHQPVQVRITDLSGNVMLNSEDVGALIAVSLPAGTYQVKAQLGQMRRNYTLALAQGQSFDLYLRLATHKS